MKQQLPDPVPEQAATWFARVQDAPGDETVRAALAQWLGQHPRHREEYQRLAVLWRAADLIPAQRLAALCEPAPVRQLPRRRLLRQALAAGVALAALGLGWRAWESPRLHHQAELQTVLGERRQVDLPDGSHLQLNSATRLQVAFTPQRREVRLLQGEAMFSVAHDSSRPFVVSTAQGEVTVTGTRFDVRQDPDRTRVVVEQGSVRVQGASDSRAQLTAGQGSHIDPQGKVAAPYAIDADALTAWRHGKLVFDNAPLSEVVREVSRYRVQPLRVAPGKVASLRLSSTFSSDDPDALLRALPSILPVVVRQLADGSSEIIAK
ncbi:MAG: FecR family protein [Paucimonas sp.]|nr:FecR family protein [Paucimonas sp.]